MSETLQRRLLQALVLLLVGALVGLGLFWQPATEPGPAQGGDFVLQSAAGPFDSRSLRGDVMLLYFGYTYCPDVCPTSLYAIAQGLEQLRPEQAARTRVVFVSVDPERDTPARLKDYAAFYHPNIIGVTGTPEQVAKVAGAYGAYYAKQATAGSAGYVVDHSAATYVVAPDGRLVESLAHGSPPEAFAAAINRWLPAPLSSPP